MKKVAFFDLDKTIYRTYSFFPLGNYEVIKGRVTKEGWVEVEQLLEKYRSGELTYSVVANLVLDKYANEIKGQKYSDFYNDTFEFLANNKQNFYSYFEKILPKLKETHEVYLITTTSQYIAEAVVNLFKLTGQISSEFGTNEGVFTGRLSKSLASGKGVVRELLGIYGKQGSIAIGDSEDDIGMLELVEFPLCINPNSELLKVAAERGWKTFNENEAEEVFTKLLGSN